MFQTVSFFQDMVLDIYIKFNENILDKKLFSYDFYYN